MSKNIKNTTDIRISAEWAMEYARIRNGFFQWIRKSDALQRNHIETPKASLK